VTPAPPLRTRQLLGLRALTYFYRRRLRAHGVQELFAAIGIAVAVALALAAAISQTSVIGSTRQVLRAVTGPAQLQLRARGFEDFPQARLAQVEAIPGVEQAAPLLERNVSVVGRGGRRASVFVAGTDVSLGVLDGLGRTLPLAAYTPETIALSSSSARELGVSASAVANGARVTLLIGGVPHALRVSSLLDRETVGVLGESDLAVMPLATMQSLLSRPGRIGRVLVDARPGQQRAVAEALRRIAGATLTVASAEQDVTQLRRALAPSGQANALFAVIGALLGMLLAFNAILLTVPERRQAIADLRLAGTRRSAIVQLTLFQALCLGVGASAVGVGAGYVLSRWVLHQSTAYLAEAFVLSGGTVVPVGLVALVAVGGVLVTSLASSIPLLDLRSSRPADAIYVHGGVPGNTLGSGVQRRLSFAAMAMLALATVLYVSAPSSALVATVALAFATVLAVPLAFAGVLACAKAVSERAPKLSTLAIALGGVRGTTLRSIALAATGAVALFGSIALGGARGDLQAGIHGFARAYAEDAPIWISEPGDNQATGQLAAAPARRLAREVADVPGVARVSAFQGGFITIGQRRAWVIARPPGGARHVLAQETIGAPGGRVASQRLGERGSVVLSRQIAQQLHVGVGRLVTLPTPSGPHSYRVAALTTNLAWIPGVVFMSAADYAHAWSSAAPSALAVYPGPGVAASALRERIASALHDGGALEVATAATRQTRIDALTGEGLSQLRVIATLLVLAAILALAAALASSINQRRRSLAGLRLSGAPPARLRRILFVEASLMLAAGCVTGALAGVYGQFIIDAYLRHVTGFPVADVGASGRPIVIFAIVLAAALAAIAVPAWLASTVAPSLALAEE
jgi:putative ABC transport system permease protein